MHGRYLRGRHVPWEEVHAVVSQEAWWVERMDILTARLGGVVPRAVRDLALMAACTCCRVHADFPWNLISACEAIGLGHPRAGRCCGQVSPSRWQLAHEYVAAVRGKLQGRDPSAVAADGAFDPETVGRVYALMGDPLTTGQILLFQRYLVGLIQQLSEATSFNLLGDATHGDPGLTFRHFPAYRFTHDAAYLDLTPASPLLTELDKRILQHVLDGATWIQRLVAADRPLCHVKYFRYQDLRISSIGCGQWRGAVPLTPYAKERVLGLIATFDGALTAWCDSRPLTENPVYDLVAFKLGPPTATKRALVRLFLLPPPDESLYARLKVLDRATPHRGY